MSLAEWFHLAIIIICLAILLISLANLYFLD